MKKWMLGLLVISSVLVFTRLELLALLGFLLAIALTPRERDWPRRLVWAYLMLFALVCALYEVAWLAGFAVPFTAVVIGLGIVSWIYAFRLRHRESHAQIKPSIIWMGIAAGLVACVYLNLPMIVHPSYAQVVRYAAKTGDDINHISMMEADRQAEGYIYTDNARNRTLISPRHIGYPQGWHINGALLESQFLKLIGKDNLANRALSYLLYKTLWVFIATFLAYQLIMEASLAFFRRHGEMPTWAAGLGALALSVGLVIGAYGYGFADFIAALALVCAGLIVACWIVEAGKPDRSPSYILGLVGLTAAATTVWVLPGATLGLLALIMLAYLYRYRLRRLELWQWGVFAAAVALSLIQVALVRQVSTGGVLARLDLGGAVSAISSVGVAIVVFVCAWLAGRLRAKRWQWLIGIIAALSIEFFLLTIYQKLTLGNTFYYADKLAILAAFVISPVLLAAVAAVLKLGNGLRPYYKSALFVVAVLALPVLLGLNPRESAFPLKNASAPISQTMATRLLATNPNDGPNLVFRGANPTETWLATKLWSQIRPYSSPARERQLDSL